MNCAGGRSRVQKESENVNAEPPGVYPSQSLVYWIKHRAFRAFAQGLYEFNSDEKDGNRRHGESAAAGAMLAGAKTFAQSR